MLDPSDRRKFAEYCLQEVKTLDSAVKQMEKIGVPEAMIKRNRSKIAAYMIVFGELDTGEDMSISAEDVGSMPNRTGGNDD